MDPVRPLRVSSRANALKIMSNWKKKKAKRKRRVTPHCPRKDLQENRKPAFCKETGVSRLFILLFLLFLFLQVIGGGWRSGVRLARQGCYGDNLRGGGEIFGSVVLHVIRGDDGHRGAALLVLMSLDVLREVVAAHEALGAFGTLKALFSCTSGEKIKQAL